MNRLFAFFGVSTALWLVYLFAVSERYPQLSERGLFGDSFGGFSALFTGLALAGTAFAIYRQDEQGRDHQRQLNRQADLQQRTAIALERNSTIDLVTLIDRMQEQNAAELSIQLKFLKAAAKDPTAAAAVAESAESAKRAVAVQRLLMQAQNQSFEALLSAWGLPIELAHMRASLGKPHDQQAWDAIIDDLSVHSGSHATSAI